MNDRFLKACRREPVDCTPVWFMRQAGRYMAEYRALRAKHSILELCKTPELAAQVTLQPIDRFPLDAAIIFADILLPLEPMGLSLEFAAGEGPVIHNPVRNQADVERLTVIDGGELEYVAEAIRQARRALNGRVPLIGICRGAVHTRQLCDRGRQLAELSPHQAVDVLRAKGVASAHGQVCAGHHRLSAAADQGRRAGHSVVRQLGGLPLGRRLCRICDAACPIDF